MRDKVYSAVINAINTTQKASGRTGAVSGSTRPMSDLSGFDSLNAVETSCDFSATLGYEIPGDVGLFFHSDTKAPRTVNEIVDAVCEIIQKQESA